MEPDSDSERRQAREELEEARNALAAKAVARLLMPRLAIAAAAGRISPGGRR